MEDEVDLWVRWREREREREEVGELWNQVKTNIAAGWRWSRVHTPYITYKIERERNCQWIRRIWVMVSSTLLLHGLSFHFFKFEREGHMGGREERGEGESLIKALSDRVDWQWLLWCYFFWVMGDALNYFYPYHHFHLFFSIFPSITTSTLNLKLKMTQHFSHLLTFMLRLK